MGYISLHDVCIYLAYAALLPPLLRCSIAIALRRVFAVAAPRRLSLTAIAAMPPKKAAGGGKRAPPKAAEKGAAEPEKKPKLQRVRARAQGKRKTGGGVEGVGRGGVVGWGKGKGRG